MRESDFSTIYRRLISLALAVFLALGTAPAGVFAFTGAAEESQGTSSDSVLRSAAADPAPIVKTGRFQFAETVLYNCQKSADFRFDERWFRQSSFTDNISLAVLSAKASLASASYYDPGTDNARTDPSKGAYNIMNLLDSIGFKDVSANKYYSLEELENSLGVALGHMTVTSGGKAYTLIAVVPRSEYYKQEWAGNFQVGSGNIHRGFKAGRDEVLRFVRQYIQQNGIKGDLKFWIPGHSRGAAVANMVGGFLAGGGAAYLGNGVKVTPQDIYCYCFAPPLSVKKGVSKAEELSVAGSGTGRYANDTPGEAFTYSGGGTLDPRAAVYKGIRAYINDTDMVSKVPPVQWGLTYYGNGQSAAGKATWKEMRAKAEAIAPDLVENYAKGDPAGFSNYTFDLASLKIVKDGSRKGGTMASFIDGRVAQLAAMIPSNEIYDASPYQAALSSAAGIYGFLLDNPDPNIFEFSDIDTGTLMRPAALTILAYAADSVKADYAAAGKEISDAEAVGIWLGDFANYISGLEVPDDASADFVVQAVAEFVAQNPDSEAVSKITAQFSGGLTDMDRTKLKLFTPSKYLDSATDEELLKYFLTACARGAAKGSAAYNDGLITKYRYRDAANVRKELYSSMSNLLENYPELEAAINGGSGSLTDVGGAVIATLAVTTDEEGNEVKLTLGDAADAALSGVLGDMLYSIAEKSQEKYGFQYPDYYADSCVLIGTVLDNITLVRQAAAQFLLGNAGESFSTEAALSNACTFVKNAGILMPAHYCESYVSWMEAREAKESSADVVKKSQNLKVKVSKTKKVKRSSVKKKKKKLSVLKVSGAAGKVTYKKKSGSSKLSVNSKTGKITVKKGTKKGTYSIKVTVKAAGNATYKPASKTVKVKIRVV